MFTRGQNNPVENNDGTVLTESVIKKEPEKIMKNFNYFSGSRVCSTLYAGL